MDMKTKCRDCVFASRPGSCDMSRHEYFQKNGASLTYDEDGHVTINGRYCSALRKEHWVKNKDRFNLPIIARAELLISNEVFIYIDNDNYSDEKLDVTLASLKEQLLPPNQIVLIINRDNINYFKLMNKVKTYELKYRLDRIMPEDDGKRIHELDAIDIAGKKLQSDYYVIMYPGSTLEDNEFFANIDEALNERLERFIMLRGTETRGPVIATAIHKKLNGNVPMSQQKLDEEAFAVVTIVHNSLLEKIEHLAKKDNQGYLIKNYQEINNE